jgi:hypothetical protein
VDGEIVGHVAVSEPQPGDDAVRLWLEQSDDRIEDVAVIGRLFVRSSARRQSIGQQLSRAVATDEAVRGKRLVLDVMDKDQVAIRLYERLGPKKIGTAKRKFGEGVASDGSVVATVMNSSGMTSGGKKPVGKIRSAIAEVYLLSLVDARERVLVATDHDFFAYLQNELAGALVEEVRLQHLPLPPDLAARVASVTATASAEMGR